MAGIFIHRKSNQRHSNDEAFKNWKPSTMRNVEETERPASPTIETTVMTHTMTLKLKEFELREKEGSCRTSCSKTRKLSRVTCVLIIFNINRQSASIEEIIRPSKAETVQERRSATVKNSTTESTFRNT